jgi:hypothetical protein
MPKCPNLKCGVEIDKLDNIVSGETVYRLRLSLDGTEAEYETDEFYPDNGENRYECHECQHVIANNEEEAIKFLKGE